MIHEAIVFSEHKHLFEFDRYLDYVPFGEHPTHTAFFVIECRCGFAQAFPEDNLRQMPEDDQRKLAERLGVRWEM